MESGKPLSSDSSRVDFDVVCQTLRTAVEPARAHAISLHDETGDILWLSESSMGPDEHNAVREALEAFSNAGSPAILAYDLGDSRSAVLLRAVSSHRIMVGAVMMIMDTRGIKKDDKGMVRLMTPKLQRALAEFAEMRRDSDSTPVALTSSPAPASALPAPFELSLADSVRIPRPQIAIPQAVLPKSPAPTLVVAPPVSPRIDRLHAALRRSPIALHVQRLVPLAKGGELTRYEVLLRSGFDAAPNAAPQAMLKAAVENGLGSMIDRRVVTELIGWLARHPTVWHTRPVMFSVNLTTTALLDEHFMRFVGLCLTKAALPEAMIAFEISVPAAVKLGDQVAGVAGALHRLGCPLVLDDFGLRTECFDLLRLPAVRYVKLAPEITSTMRSDKVSQAAITAVVQMARVLGLHTVAKHTETAAEQEWLVALGVDFIQSNALSPSAPIETLSQP